ncbi:MAG: hypothetical protein ACXABY_11210 [Candidatus Thorarchaeota archaeon]|jgi:hypothetical protein
MDALYELEPMATSKAWRQIQERNDVHFTGIALLIRKCKRLLGRLL